MIAETVKYVLADRRNSRSTA